MPDIYVSNSKLKAQSSKPEIQEQPESHETMKPSSHNLPGHTHNPLTAYSYQPDNVQFETQEKEEKVVLLLRSHPITNVPWIVLALVLALAPALLGTFPLLSFLPGKFQTVAIFAWYLVTAAFILENFLTWFFNIYLVTDERIVDIDFFNLIYREVSETKIDKIQDVTSKFGGVLRALFNYDDIYIQTAGTVPNFEFLAVPKPDEVRKILQELRTQEEQEAIEGRVR